MNGDGDNMKTILKQNKKLIGINLFVMAVASLLSTLMAYFIQIIIDLVAASNRSELKAIIFYTIIFLIAYFIFQFLKAYFSKKFQNNFINKLRHLLFEKIFKRIPEDFRKYDSSDYLSVLINDIQLFHEGALNSSVLIVESTIAAIIAIAALFYVDPYITIVIIGCIIIMYIVPYIFGKIIQKQQIVLSKDLMKLTGMTKSYLSGFSTIFTYLIQKTCIHNFSHKNNTATNSRMKMDQKLSLSESLSAVLSIGTEFIILFLSAFGVLNGRMSIGTMVAIMQLSGGFIQPIMIIMQNIPKVIGGKTIIHRFEDIIEYEATGFSGTIIPEFQHSIELKNLQFAYDENRLILEQVNCIFEKNKKYALLGRSGSGKSTLVGLLTGLSSTYKGSILFDGCELKNLNLNKVLSLVTVTQQDSFLFDSTILENITLGEEYNKEDLHKVCHMSGVDKFIDEVPDGMNCNIIECGNNLSGGQKQRILIARALLQKKPIMILDESTAAVDKKTAYDIEQCLLNIPDLTLITITHNLDEKILKKYDELLFLENGKILNTGSFLELYNKSMEFQQFMNIAYEI